MKLINGELFTDKQRALVAESQLAALTAKLAAMEHQIDDLKSELSNIAPISMAIDNIMNANNGVDLVDGELISRPNKEMKGILVGVLYEGDIGIEVIPFSEDEIEYNLLKQRAEKHLYKLSNSGLQSDGQQIASAKP